MQHECKKYEMNRNFGDETFQNVTIWKIERIILKWVFEKLQINSSSLLFPLHFCCWCFVKMISYWQMLVCSLTARCCALCFTKCVANMCIVMTRNHVTCEVRVRRAQVLNPSNWEHSVHMYVLCVICDVCFCAAYIWAVITWWLS
jgi:hypothetical protein